MLATRLSRYIKPTQIKFYSVRNCSVVGNSKHEQNPAPDTANSKVGGFAKAFEKQSNILEEPENEQNHSFATLLRNSKLMDLGDPSGKIVTGRIFHIVEDDLYIDFGWKFHCVCTRPTTRGEEYVRGARVRLQVKDLELSSRFLGSSTDLTLLEADCKILGLVNPSARSEKTENQ